MKYIRLNKYQSALVMRNGAYVRMLQSGGNWVRMTDTVFIYEKVSEMKPPCELTILLADEQLAAALEVVSVGDDQLVIMKENGLFKRVLTSGRYVYWKGIIEREFRTVNMSELFVPADLNVATYAKTEFINYVRTITLENHEQGLLIVDGKVEQSLQAGTYYLWKNALNVSVLKADMRLVQLEVNGQEILTLDKANLRLNIVAQYKIVDANKALIQNKDYEKQLYTLIQLAYREYITTLRLDELLERKSAVVEYVKKEVSAKADMLGLQLVSTGIKDIVLPGDVKDIMNQVLIAEKKAQANTIMRREETASTRSLLNTAKLMEENKMLFKLKEMEYIEKIAERINNVSISGDNKALDQLRQIFTPAT